MRLILNTCNVHLLRKIVECVSTFSYNSGMKFGILVKKIRQRYHMTQEELAHSLGYSDKSMISKIEKGESEMSYDKAVLFVEKYGLNANELFFDISEQPSLEGRDKKILTIQDISCYGQCSITVALPILSACGYETAILPTSILSTHTSGFKDFQYKDMDEELERFLEHWKREQLSFDAVYTGYLGSISLVDFTIKAIKQCRKENSLIIIDPAMGDNGKLYPAFNMDYAIKMRELIKDADIILPNITEACFMSGFPFKEKYDQQYVEDLLKELRKYTTAKIILTDVSLKKNQTGVYMYADNYFQYYRHHKIGHGFHGTGDVFSSSFVASYLKTKDLYLSVKVAADYVYRCINYTQSDKSHWYGVKFEPLLNGFVNKLNDIERTNKKMIYKHIDETVGKTPLVELTNYERNLKLNARIIAKVEYFNPAGSVKDRIAKAMIDKAEKDGLINKNTILIEPTSGNTGIGLAMVAASRGYRLIIVMPDTMSIERRKLLKAYGAELVLTDGKLGMKGAIAKANELHEQYPNSVIPSQFTNPENPNAHYLTTGPEIFEELSGRVDIFVAGVGTGGTISGVGKYLKEQNPDIKIVAVEPESSPVLSKGTPGPHKIQGIGAGFVPDTLNTEIYDEIITVSNEDAFATGRTLARNDGLLVGISSGAAVKAATVLAQRKENQSKTIVVLLPDTGERYLSTAMFEEQE